MKREVDALGRGARDRVPAPDRTIGRVDTRIGSQKTSSLFLTGADARLSRAASSVSGLPPLSGATVTASEIDTWLDLAPDPESFTFGPSGTLESVTRNGTSLSPEETIDGQYADFDGPISMDADGRVLATPDGWTFRYDGRGRMREAENGGSITHLLYDGFDRLIEADDVTFQYAGGAILSESQGGMAPKQVQSLAEFSRASDGRSASSPSQESVPL